MSFLAEQYYALRTLAGTDSPSKMSAYWISNKIKSPDNTFKLISINLLPKKLGKFLWIYADGDKLTNLEKYIPAFSLSLSAFKEGTYLNVISCNFMRIIDRMQFFDQFFDGYTNFFTNYYLSEDVTTEASIGNVYDKAYSGLKSIGYEWAIREVNVKDIKVIYDVSWTHSAKVLLTDTSLFTGVNEDKIKKIWEEKIKTQMIREKSLLEKFKKRTLGQ